MLGPWEGEERKAVRASQPPAAAAVGLGPPRPLGPGAAQTVRAWGGETARRAWEEGHGVVNESLMYTYFIV